MSWSQSGWGSGSGGSWDSIGSSAIYGVSWNEGNSSPVLTRLGSTAGFAASASPGNNNLPVHRLMRRCVMRDDGGIVYYLDQNNSLVKQGGGASVLDGTDGQVMVEIPLFWYKYSYSGTTHSWWISLNKFSGAERHPAFYKAGAWVANRYIGAYEGSMWDATTSAMVSDADADTNMYAAGDKLCSVSGYKPKTYETIVEFRSMAEQRGAGWHQLDWYLWSAVQLLYITEYANLDAQTTLGTGNTCYTAYGFDETVANAGLSNADGNVTNSSNTAFNTLAVDGTKTNGVDVFEYNSYRGIENWFGSLFKFLDGINIHSSIANGLRVYVCQDYTAFASDTDTGYSLITSDLAQAAGVPITIVPTSHGFLPKTVGGQSYVTYLADRYETIYTTTPDAGWRMVYISSAHPNGGVCGPFYMSCSNASGITSYADAGRLAY